MVHQGRMRLSSVCFQPFVNQCYHVDGILFSRLQGFPSAIRCVYPFNVAPTSSNDIFVQILKSAQSTTAAGETPSPALAVGHHPQNSHHTPSHEAEEALKGKSAQRTSSTCSSVEVQAALAMDSLLALAVHPVRVLSPPQLFYH